MTAATSMLEDVSGELPWDLVVTFATMPRWKPDDVARSAHEIAITQLTRGQTCLIAALRQAQRLVEGASS